MLLHSSGHPKPSADLTVEQMEEERHGLVSRWIVQTQCWGQELSGDRKGAIGESDQRSKQQRPDRLRVPTKLLV